MTSDDIIRMAREAGFEIEKTLYGPVPCVDGRGIDDRLERFAALVSAAEREACAKVCETEAKDHWDEMAYRALQETAELIRKRGEVKP